jgi:hypothetical protein
MANQFVNLPTPSANGAGTPVDVSSFGSFKTLVVSGDLAAIIAVEANLDPMQAGTWVAVASFPNPGQVTIQVAAHWLRTRVSAFNSRAGGTPEVDCGGSDDGTGFAAIPVPAADGVGAAVDTSSLGLFKSVQVGSAFRGTVLIEESEDGTTAWGTVMSFSQPGLQSSEFTAHWMRARRVGTPTVNPGTPIANVGATNDQGGGGGGGGNSQRFRYTATGAEGSDFTVNLPVARANDSYLVSGTCQGVNMIVDFDFPDILAGDRTTLLFRCITTGSLTAGDVIYFEAIDPT